MPFRQPIRTVTAATAAVLAASGLAACGRSTAHARPAGNAPAATTPQQPPPSSADPSPTTSSPAPSPTTTAPSPSTSPTKRGALPPYFGRVPGVKDKVVFITIDDGWQQDAGFVKLIEERRTPITLFLTNSAIKKNYGYFKRLQDAGALIENHTMTHPYLPGLSYAQQKKQICDTSDIYAKQYGSRPTLMRPPYGSTNKNTMKAARACGIKAMLFWREVVQNGQIQYQLPGRLHRGDILLVHFNPGMAHDFKTLLSKIKAQGFTPAPLKEHLPAEYLQP